MTDSELSEMVKGHITGMRALMYTGQHAVAAVTHCSAAMSVARHIESRLATARNNNRLCRERITTLCDDLRKVSCEFVIGCTVCFYSWVV